jgi:RNA polymerase sigma factor (sigma-70 family)
MSKEFDILLSTVKDKIFRFALKMLGNDYEEARDVVQDVSEKLWKMKNELIHYENPEALTIKMTKNLCLDRMKHEKRKTQKLYSMNAETDALSETADCDEKDTYEILKKLIGELPEKQRMIIHLRDVEGFDLNEIANIMEININAVRMNLSRGRTTIRQKLIKTMNHGL